jgi:hypothetical protein
MIDLMQQLHKRSQHGKLELECTNIQREMNEAGLIKLVPIYKEAASIVQHDMVQGRCGHGVAGYVCSIIWRVHAMGIVSKMGDRPAGCLKTSLGYRCEM